MMIPESRTIISDGAGAHGQFGTWLLHVGRYDRVAAITVP